MGRFLAALAVLLGSLGAAHAQSTGNVQLMCRTSAGILAACSASNPVPTGSASSVAQATTQTVVSCGTTSGTVYVGGSATNGFVRIKVQGGSSTGVYFNWTGAAATTATGELMGAGESIVWGPLSNSVTCITASGSVSVVVVQ